MRGVIGRVLLVAGVLAMSDAAVADEPKFSPSKKETYPEVCVLKPYYDKKFLKPVEGVPLYRKTDDKGVTRFWLWGPAATGTSTPTKDSEITDRDGVVWVVEKAEKGTMSHTVTVKKKPKD